MPIPNPMITCSDAYGNKHVFHESTYINREAIYGIYFQRKSLLLEQDSKSLLWECPGGGKENTESDFECLRREFIEETGLEIFEPIQLEASFESYFFDVTSNQPWKTLRKFYFISKATGEAKINGNNEDVHSVKFVPFQEIPTISMNENVRSVLISSIKKLKSKII